MAEKRKCQRCGRIRDDVSRYIVQTFTESEIDYCGPCRNVVARLYRVTRADGRGGEPEAVEAEAEPEGTAEASTEEATEPEGAPERPKRRRAAGKKG